MQFNVSVCTIVIGFDQLRWQVESLKRQDCDFPIEWVIVDDNYEEHKEMVAETIGNSFAFQHLPPRVASPYYSAGMCYNTTLTHARGELIYCMAEKIVPKLNCIRKHWELHQKYPNAFFSGRRLRCGSPSTQASFDEMMYVDGVDDRQSYLMSQDPVNVEPLGDGIYKMGGIKMESWWCGCNDSAPLEHLLEVNGLDETLDGMRRDIDRNLAWRLHNYGLDYIFDETNAVLALDGIGGQNKATAPECGGLEYMKALFAKLKKDKGYLAEHKINLREEREKFK